MFREPQRFIPLRPVEFLVLVSLAEGDLHGYGLTQALDERSSGAVRLEPGNLYKVLKRLVSDGLIESAGHKPAADLENERRHYYRLTRLGERVVAVEARRVQALVATPAVRSLVKRFAPAS